MPNKAKKIKPIKAWAVITDNSIVGSYHHHGYEIYQTRKDAVKYWDKTTVKNEKVKISRVKIIPV